MDIDQRVIQTTGYDLKDTPDAWLAHHQIAYEWSEMPALQATVPST